mgnify:CR=1 FL=1
MSKSNETTPNVPTLRFDGFVDNWTIATLGDVCSYRKERRTLEKKYYVSTENILQNYQGIERFDSIDKISGDAFDKNDVLMGNIRPYLKKVCFADFDGVCNADVLVFKSKALNSKYLHCVLANDSFINYVMSSVKGSKMPRGDKNYIMQYPLSYPSELEQAKISNFIEILTKRIAVQNKIISKYETLIKGIRERIVNCGWQWKKLDELIQEGVVRLNRGNIIPKHPKDNTYKYPVYSSSTQNNGLMGYNDTYMFDKELITWSIDGGGNFFYRKKHKFNVTNVCGIMQVDENVYSYRFIAEMLTYQHSKMKFDYQSKAHPSVISSLYSLPCLPISEQNFYCQLFIALDKKMYIEQCSLNKLKEQKKYLLSKMFI